ncbi:MAG: glycosyltransferase family 2 protein [Candidatus Omnitrophota bacterium]
MINIIVPVYNEARHIAENIASIKLTMLKFSNSQIIVVDDGSTDKTYDLLRAVKDIILLRHKINLGKGAAIRTGLERTQGEYILFLSTEI